MNKNQILLNTEQYLYKVINSLPINIKTIITKKLEERNGNTTD